MAVRFTLIFFLAATQFGCAQMIPGAGQAYVEPIDDWYGYLGQEMMIRFYDVLRPDRRSLVLDSNPKYGEKKYLTNHGYIPTSGAFIKRRDICNRQQDAYCKSLAFGEELVTNPGVRAAIEDWLLHFCERVPLHVTEKTPLYYTLDDRQREVRKLRWFMGCDGAPKVPRTIHFLVVRNFDDVFNGDETHTDSVLQQSVVERRILKLNQ